MRRPDNWNTSSPEFESGYTYAARKYPSGSGWRGLLPCWKQNNAQQSWNCELYDTEKRKDDLPDVTVFTTRTGEDRFPYPSLLDTMPCGPPGKLRLLRITLAAILFLSKSDSGITERNRKMFSLT